MYPQAKNINIHGRTYIQRFDGSQDNNNDLGVTWSIIILE